MLKYSLMENRMLHEGLFEFFDLNTDSAATDLHEAPCSTCLRT
jgi:hypothetical protein